MSPAVWRALRQQIPTGPIREGLGAPHPGRAGFAHQRPGIVAPAAGAAKGEGAAALSASNTPGSRPQGRRAARRPRTRPFSLPRRGRGGLAPGPRGAGAGACAVGATVLAPGRVSLFRVSPCRSTPHLRSVGFSRPPCRCSSTGSWLWPRPSAPGTPAGRRATRASAASWRCSSAASWPVSSATSARVGMGSRASGARPSER